MSPTFFRDALQTVLRLRGNPSIRVVDLCLETLHAGVVCSDGEAGLALNYDQEGEEQLPSALLLKMARRLLERVEGEPLLEQTLFQAEEAPTLRAVTMAILNALSAPLCQPERAAELGFAVLAGRLPLASFWGTGTSLAVVGCGGFLEEAVRLPWLRQVSCLDLNFVTPQRSERYRAYLQQVVDPQRESKEIVLDDGSGAERILAETDLLCVSGSTLCNDTLDSLLQAAGPCRAVVLEGHSAGLWPGLVQPYGVHHVVRTPVDLPVAALLRRYAGQLERGHAQLGPGAYVDCLFPERTTLVSISGSARPRGRRWLLLQARDADDAMIAHERECFERALGRGVEIRSLLEGGLRVEELTDCAAVLVGGSGRYGAAANREFWFPAAMESLRLLLRQELPLFASCWGIQALSAALGGRVEVRPDYAEFGSVRLRLSESGSQDPLFVGLEGEPWVQAGHSETVTQLAPGMELLASSATCPTQVVRLRRRPVYACQFHAELRAEDLQQRMDHYGLQATGTGPCSSADEFGPRLLGRFAQLVEAL